MDNPSLRIDGIDMKDIGPFPKLKLNFKNKPGISLICGDNGVGKTTILEAITAAFSLGHNHRIKRRQAGDSGSVDMIYRSPQGKREVRLDIKEINPSRGEFLNAYYPEAQNLIHIRASRNIEYFQQTSISRDPEFDERNFGSRITSSPNSNEIKSWLTNRYLLKPHSHKSSWTEQMVKNLEVAKDLFSLLDSEMALEEVDVTTFEVMVSTPNGIIPFELMSSGFRSTYYLILSIIKEIEFRRLSVSADKFSGVILVDEIDLHLHPSWQQEIGRILTSTFSSAQIIATTHSPHVIQTTSAADVVSLTRGANGEIERKSITTGSYGFSGWSIEEILEEVMGVKNTRTKYFRDALCLFDKAIDLEDSHGVNEALYMLREMLHPQSPIRKLIEVQSAPFAIDDFRSDLKG